MQERPPNPTTQLRSPRAVAARLALLTLAAFTLAACSGQAPGTLMQEEQEAAEDTPYDKVKVYYATDRKKTGNPKPKAFYGSDPGAMSYGQALVSIPRDHRIGALESPSIWEFEFSENPERHVVLLGVKELDRKTTLTAIRNDIASTLTRKALVFIHGYANSFEDAARRTAQIKYDLQFKGPAIFYSWPSKGTPTLAAYSADKKTIDKSYANLKALLTTLASDTGASSIYVIAHSMGTYGVTKALAEVAGAGAAGNVSAKIKKVILAAPDIDRQVFVNEIMPKMRKLKLATVVYASDKDSALEISRQINAAPRLGHMAPAPLLDPDVELIDASLIDTSLVGHSYYGENRSVISDIFGLVRDVPIDRRFGLHEVAAAQGTYWQFRP